MPARIQRVIGLKVYFLPITTRVPLKFGHETLTSTTCLRVWMEVVDATGRKAEGWGETPLSVQWSWPSSFSYEPRHAQMRRFCLELASAWLKFQAQGHALEVGYEFLEAALPQVLAAVNQRPEPPPAAHEPMPWLAALICASAFDLALHDAYGRLAGYPIYQCYGQEHLSRDLASMIEPQPGTGISFQGKYPSDHLLSEPLSKLTAWHLVGGADPLDQSELTGMEPSDGYPVLLEDWIRQDGLKCLKIKLRGNDSSWDFVRLVRVAQIGFPLGVEWLTADFNCTVQQPEYVNEILDRLARDYPKIHQRILYVEQPFPYDLERNRIDVHSVSKRKPLFLDESAHDWRLIRLGQHLGWSGVALKTCKTQTGAVLSACWAQAHGMALMVQDLTNPMLAQVSHLSLAAHVRTIMGVETNSMQFYPDASAAEAKIHPGLYQRRHGMVDLSSIAGDGFGYRTAEINRALPAPAFEGGT